MNKGFPSHQEVAQIRLDYPPGTRIELINMYDPYAPVPAGTCGTVQLVDDRGNVHMKWDNGRSLSLIPGEDSFRKIKQELSQGQQMGGMKL